MKGPLIQHRANDLLRASTLALLAADDPEVVKDLKKVKRGTIPWRIGDLVG